MTKRWSLVLGLALTAAPLVAAGLPVKRVAEPEVVVSDVSARFAERAELHRSLEARELASGLSRALVVKLTAAEKAAADTQVNAGRLRVGIEKSVGAVLRLGGALQFGDFASEADGTVLWSGRIASPGASALRLHLSPFDLPESAELFVYAADGQAYGPYTGRGPVDDGQLWTNTILGDEVRLQLRVAPEDVAHTRLVVADIGYMGAAFPMATSAFCADNAACVVNAGCVSVSAVADARDAVAHILFASGGSYWICSGGLVADSDAASVVPYFLTANHCLSTASEASSLETYFDYQTTCSSPNCGSPYGNPRSPDTLGAQVVKTSSTSDYTLLRLSSAPATDDGVVRYLGWNSTAVANSNGTALHRISHPQGSPQAYSAHTVDTSKPTCRSWPRGNWIYSRDTQGATEGGSSGSPVVNGAGQVVGQLSGGCGYNVGDNCDAASNATVDGAFAAYFSQVSPFLAGGGPSCSAAGASCSANSECCSATCKGKPGAKTCK
ncbi:MAG TPA: serine protease [Thermoanaerobaculia bacterium]|nr:serine protease [Thermoanaerobaculia bacterium]